jgi:hypothetical protein
LIAATGVRRRQLPARRAHASNRSTPERQIRPLLVEVGIATDTDIDIDIDIDEHLANVATGRLDLSTAPVISAWACTPTLA